MFMWPKLKTNETVEMLDLMNTEFAQSLSNTDEFQYLSKFNSTPGLLASLTMKNLVLMWQQSDHSCFGAGDFEILENLRFKM